MWEGKKNMLWWLDDQRPNQYQLDSTCRCIHTDLFTKKHAAQKCLQIQWLPLAQKNRKGPSAGFIAKQELCIIRWLTRALEHPNRASRIWKFLFAKREWSNRCLQREDVTTYQVHSCEPDRAIKTIVSNFRIIIPAPWKRMMFQWRRKHKAAGKQQGRERYWREPGIEDVVQRPPGQATEVNKDWWSSKIDTHGG